MKIWCEFENILTDDSLSRKYCFGDGHCKRPELSKYHLSFAEAPWKDEHARLLWMALSLYPVILCCKSVGGKRFWMKSQRAAWSRRELGRQVEIYVYTSSPALVTNIKLGDILITTSQKRKECWEANGGICWLYEGYRVISVKAVCDIIETLASQPLDEPKIPITPVSVHVQELPRCPVEVNWWNDTPVNSLGLACRNILVLVLKYSSELTGTDFYLVGEEKKSYGVASALKSLSHCSYCLIKWALLYAYFGIGLSVGDVIRDGSPCPLCSLQSAIAAEIHITNRFDADHACDKVTPCVMECVSRKRSCKSTAPSEMGDLLMLPELRALHLLVLNYCVGYRPRYVLTRPMSYNDYIEKISAPNRVRDVLESVFTDCHHLCCYRDAAEWRAQLSTMIVEGRRDHKIGLHRQWDHMVSGEEGNQDSLYCSNDDAIETLIDNVLADWRCIENPTCASGADSYSTPLPTLAGIAVVWTDYSSLSHAFCMGRLYHFLPLWQIVCGLVDAITYLEQRAAWKKKRFTDDRWKADYFVCIGILRLLVDSRASSSQVPTTAAEHVDSMLASVRGRCWVRLLYDLRHVGAGMAEVDTTVRNALDACGQLRCVGGLTEADVEEIEQFASSFRAVMFKSSRTTKTGASRYRQVVSPGSCDNDDDLTPPKQYVAPPSHARRLFRGRLVRHKKTNAGHSDDEAWRRLPQRRRLLYSKIDQHSMTRTVDENILWIDSGRTINASCATCFNDRGSGMIVEKFALCRYLSVIGSSAASDIDLHLYNTLDDPTGAMRISDFLETDRGSGAWVHGRARSEFLMEGYITGIAENLKVEWLASYCEGSIWLTLMVLVLWDVIYDPTYPLSMMREFLDRPIDLLPERHCLNVRGLPIRSDGFYMRRRKEILAVINNLRQSSVQELYDLLSVSLRCHRATASFAVQWHKVDDEFVLSVGCALGSQRLAVIVEEMIRDPVCYSRGMPDLMFCVHHNFSLSSTRFYPVKRRRVEDGKEGRPPWCFDRIFVSEVKSTNDKLSVWQKAWIRLLERAGVPFEECRVN